MFLFGNQTSFEWDSYFQAFIKILVKLLFSEEIQKIQDRI